MGNIIKLDKQLANQIAAGEVVERPVSIVKELVENSIDAGANKIVVDITDGGISEIVISDNGNGILKEDLPLVIEKYATSKIKSINDLYNIMTFGFRGEAIASISSVSNFEIISKHIDSNIGYSLKIDNGQVGQISEKMIDSGTKIIVQDLFYNTPARLNYLKKPRTEYNHILETINNFAIAYPNIGFELINDGKQVFKYNSGDNLETRIYNIYNKEFLNNLLKIDFELNGVKISGYISDPKVSFGNRSKQSLFINKRIIKSPLLTKAISNAYNRFIPHNMFGAYLLNIDIDPTQIDVNVHPRKLEVRFVDESNIFRSFYNVIQTKLDNVSLINSQDSEEKEEDNENIINNHFQGFNNYSSSFGNNINNSFKSEKKEYYTGSGTKFKSYSPYKNIESNPDQIEISTVPESNDLHDTKLGKIVGQLHNSYILVETKTGLKILDQHALAERILYERLVSNQYKAKTQGLLIAESIKLQAEELNILETNKSAFKELGFEFEILNAGNILINAIPDFVQKEDIKQVFEGIIGDLVVENFSKSKTLEEIRNKIFAYASCRGSIKFGNKLNLFEMNKLLNDSILDYSATCPHGRPVVYDISLDELKDKYER